MFVLLCFSPLGRVRPCLIRLYESKIHLEMWKCTREALEITDDGSGAGADPHVPSRAAGPSLQCPRYGNTLWWLSCSVSAHLLFTVSYLLWCELGPGASWEWTVGKGEREHHPWLLAAAPRWWEQIAPWQGNKRGRPEPAAFKVEGPLSWAEKKRTSSAWMHRRRKAFGLFIQGELLHEVWRWDKVWHLLGTLTSSEWPQTRSRPHCINHSCPCALLCYFTKQGLGPPNPLINVHALTFLKCSPWRLLLMTLPKTWAGFDVFSTGTFPTALDIPMPLCDEPSSVPCTTSCHVIAHCFLQKMRFSHFTMQFHQFCHLNLTPFITSLRKLQKIHASGRHSDPSIRVWLIKKSTSFVTLMYHTALRVS